MNTKQEIRVRIAPSPTGDPHVGTAFVGLFNHAFARKNGGKFILRIEDTDRARAKPSSEAMIEQSLSWLGLDWDEGPSKPGPYGPYRQSERLPIYKEHIALLVERGAAYPCFCTAERLEVVRKQQKEDGAHKTGYDRHCRDIDRQAAEGRIRQGEAHVYRLKMPLTGQVSFRDELRGKIEIDAMQLDDQVLMKTDGYPTYHLANVVDDHLMKITHVIRAEEWISSTPKHVVLYQGFGWDEPVWVHLPLLRNSDKSKISKRKNPVSLNYFRRAGFLPEALVNFLGLMGWSFGGDREVFSLAEMIEVFDLSKISLGDPIFDMKKLTWLNQLYMHKMDADQFADYLLREVFSREALKQLQPLALERMARFEQFVDNNSFFFNGALSYAGLDILPKGKDLPELKKMLRELLDELDELYEWRAEKIGELLGSFREEIGWKPKDFFMSVRLIATGRKDSPPLNESLEIIGREMVRFRVRDFLGSCQG